MRRSFAFAAAIMTAYASGQVAAKSVSPPSEIILSGDYVVTVMVEGQRAELIVDAATPDRPVLNPAFVERIGLGKSMIGGGLNIGPVNMRANTKVINFNFGDLDGKRRAVWADRAYTDKYDGGVGPGGIPFDIVTLQLKQPEQGEQLYTLPLVENGNSVAEMMIGGKTIDISFTHKRSRSLATAAAGAVIAQNNGGKFSSAGETTEIAYGVERPIRALTLDSPVIFIGRSLNQIFVRTQDNGDTSTIMEEGTEADSSEIVVIGKSDKKDKNRYSLTLGRDDLAHCSSITYDKRAKQIRLMCKAAAS